MGSEVATVTDDTTIDRAAVLRSLKLNPSDPNVQAMLLVCDRYDLDPVLKHIVLIDGRPYVTRDGYLHVAHRSGQLDGIEIGDTGESNTEWWASCSVYRKDMSRPFTYRGRYPKGGSNKRYGPEMAVKVAEVMALRRAFDVTGIGAADEIHTDGNWSDEQPAVEPPAAVEPVPDGWDSWEDVNAAHEALWDRVKKLGDEQRAAVKARLDGVTRPLTPEQVADTHGFIDDMEPF